MKSTLALTGSAIVALAGTTAGAQPISWLSPVDGNWNDSANWEMGNIPNVMSEEAVLGHSGAYTVSLTNNFTIGGVSVTNPNAGIAIGANQLTLAGGLLNEGVVLINSAGSAFNGLVFFNTDATISGAGQIVLNGLTNPDDAGVQAITGSVITHASGHTIRGSGRLLGAIDNNGLVIADEPAGMGLLLGGVLDQTGGGSAGADNGARLLLGNAGHTIGGELFTTNGGEIVVFANNHMLDGVTVSGDLVIPGSSRTLLVVSDITNDGVFRINPELSVFNATLRFDADATLGGAGEVIMRTTGDFNDAQIKPGGAFTVTIGAGQSVRGSGLIDGATGSVINRGVINADDPAQALGLLGNHVGDGGVYLADGGELNLRNTASVTNAFFDSSGDGRLELDIGGVATVTDSTNAGMAIVRGNGGTLALSGAFTNTGTLALNPEANVFNANVRIDTNTTILGDGQIVMTQAGSPGDARIRVQDGAALTIGADQTVRGSGLIETDDVPESVVINLGTINADHAAKGKAPARPLELQGAHNGMGAGVYRADDGIMQLGNGLSITGATFDSSGEGFVGVINGGTATVGDATNAGELRLLGESGVLTLTGELINNGTLTINSNANVFNATLRMDAPGAMIGGSGMVRMIAAGSPGDAQLVADGVEAFIGENQTVAGSGLIDGRGAGMMTNLGVIVGDDPSAHLELQGAHQGGPGGVYRGQDGGVLVLDGAMTLQGGLLETAGDGQIAVTGGLASIGQVQNTGALNVWGENATLELHDSITNNGAIGINSNANIFNARLRLTGDHTIDGTGTISMQTAGSAADAVLETSAGFTGVLGAGQTLTGDGLINGAFTILGAIDPAGPSRLLTTDSITLGADASVRFDLGGDSAPAFDRISVRSGESIDLGGASAVISIDDGYLPSFGDTWDIISGDTTGTFDEVVVDDAPFGQVYRVIYANDRVYAILTCDADLTGDGGIDFFDVSIFLNYFSNQDVRGDLTGDGQFNFFDVSLFLQLFGQGCNP